MRKTAVLVVCLLVSTLAFAQGEAKKPLSPPAQASATIGGSTITVDYSAPSMRGRRIMGELVPFGKVWRTGANAATTLTTSADLMIGDLHVPAGKYTIFTVPGEKEWTLIVNKQNGQWGSSYDQAQDLGRVVMSVKPLATAVETFVIELAGAGTKNGTLIMRWEQIEASVPLMVH